MKTLLKNIIVPVLSSPPANTLASIFFGHGIPVFMLHRIADETLQVRGTSVQHLHNCLSYLKKNNYTLLSLESLVTAIRQKISLPEKAVVFTMDDGYLEQAQIAAPIFQAFNCPLTFFVITGLLDQTLWPWDAQVSWIIDHTDKNLLSLTLDDETIQIKLEKGDRHLMREWIRNILKEINANDVADLVDQLAVSAGLKLSGTSPPDYQPLNWDIARKLEQQNVQFSPHSVTHRILSKLDRKSCEQEIMGSWKTLKKELSHPLNIFCYPTGRKLDFGPREIEILKQAAFTAAVTTTPGYFNFKQNSNNQLFRLPRFELPDTMTDFIQCCSWLELAKEKKHHR